MIRTANILTCQGMAGMLLLFVTFAVIEPTVSWGAGATSQFTVSQVITSEITFVVTVNDYLSRRDDPEFPGDHQLQS